MSNDAIASSTSAILLDLISTFIDGGFSDYWFPVTEQHLPHSLRPSQRRRFMDTQQLVMTKSMVLEKGDGGQHSHFQQGEPVPLEPKGILGTEGFGEVDRVLSQIVSMHGVTSYE